MCIIAFCFFFNCLSMEVLQRPEILPLFMLYRTSVWKSLDVTKPITDNLHEKLSSLGYCVFWEAHEGLNSLKNKTINFLQWGWSEKYFQDRIGGAGLLNFAWNSSWAPQTFLITDLLNAWRNAEKLTESGYVILYLFSC